MQAAPQRAKERLRAKRNRARAKESIARGRAAAAWMKHQVTKHPYLFTLASGESQGHGPVDIAGK